MAYIIKNDEIIARCSNKHKAGPCEFGWNYVEETLNANFDKVLVNRQKGKISHAKKYEKKERREELCLPYAKILDPYFERDFIIEEDTEVLSYDYETIMQNNKAIQKLAEEEKR